MEEMLGLTWDCVDISEEAITENRAYIYVDKEVQRVDKAAIQELRGKDVILVFLEESKKNKTVLVLKLPKTESSIRKVFLPKSVAEMLVEWKKGQDKIKETLGDEYMNYNLVMAINSFVGSNLRLYYIRYTLDKMNRNGYNGYNKFGRCYS